MKIRKIFLPFLCLAFLCGCAANGDVLDHNDITDSNTTQTEQTTENTTAPTAKAVNNYQNLSKTKVIWGPGNITDHQQPTEPVTLQERFAGLDAYWLLKSKKKICLTFDEGYENGFTPSILDTLKEKDVRAIFFVTYDFAKDNPKLIRRMIDEGHIVGNHTYRHYTMDEVSEDVAIEEIQYLHSYIKDNFNYTMSLFRFPKGEFSEQTLGIVEEQGYKSIFWSFAYADWDPNAQSDEGEALEKICSSTHDGEIMLLHAVSKTNAVILGQVIDNVREQGYEFTTEV